jgi:hypothetical protein
MSDRIADTLGDARTDADAHAIPLANPDTHTYAYSYADSQTDSSPTARFRALADAHGSRTVYRGRYVYRSRVRRDDDVSGRLGSWTWRA